MRRTVLLFTTITLAGGLLAVGSQPVLACSCAGEPGPLPLEFEGDAIRRVGPGTAGEVWRFRVLRAGKGTTAGAAVDVMIDGTKPPGPDGIQGVSSCSIGAYPTPGQRYRVGAYEGSNPDGSPRFFANVCGGFLRALDTDAPAATPSPDPRDGGPNRVAVVIGVGALALVAAGAFGLARRRRPAAPA